MSNDKVLQEQILGGEYDASVELDDMRCWLADLSFGDYEPEEFHDPSVVSDRMVVVGVRRFYDGGLAGFLRNAS